MSWLIILSVILLLILFVLLLPVKLAGGYDPQRGAFAKVGVLCFYWSVYPQKEKSKSKPKAKKRKTKPDKPKEQKKGILAQLEQFRDVAKIVADALGVLARHVVISRFNMELIVAGDDAAKTAVEYGAANAGMGMLLGLLQNAFRLKRHNIRIMPDFDAQTTRITADVKISMSVCFILAALGKALYQYMATLSKKQKGGAVA